MKVYVGMGLTNAPKAFRDIFNGEFKDMLRAVPDVKVLDFIGLENGTEEDVYLHDRKCTEEADLCIFICDHPSIGLGMEIAFRLFARRPMKCFVRSDVKITRMVTGMCKVEGVVLHRYVTPKDIIRTCFPAETV
ncbi:hypothetical protein KTR10_01250 [Candidatus Kaiserbacteria bacterium]|nr:hypothetical protein [Candidatus Kaiserbacteria bacterium]